MACSNACPCARALGSFSGRSSRREMDPDCRENQRRRRIAGRPATRITGARRLLILRFSRGHVTAERYLQFEAEARHPRTPTGEDAGLLFVYVYEARSASQASRRSGVPVSSNRRVGHGFRVPRTQLPPSYAPNGFIPSLLKPPATGKKLPVVYMLCPSSSAMQKCAASSVSPRRRMGI
jgi:hypothetical protein